MAAMTIGKKLYLGFGTLVVVTLSLGGTAYVSLAKIGDNLTTITGNTATKVRLANAMDIEVANLLAEDRGILVRGFMKDQDAMQAYDAQFDASSAAILSHIDAIKPLLSKPEGRQAMQDFQALIGPMREANQKVFEAAMAGRMKDAVAAYADTFLPLHKRATPEIATVAKVQDDLLAIDSAAAFATMATSRWLTMVMILLACGVGVALIFSVRKVNAVLRGSAAELSEVSSQIVAAAGQVSASSQAMAQSASQQAASLEETSSASNEINSMAKRAAENSNTAAHSVEKAQAGFATANLSLTEMVAAMEGIHESSQKIAQIIKVIDSISFQTNILALNAAVEAARAGQAGMGFAVVAEEVRNLAQRSAQAAKDTSVLIEDSIERASAGRTKVGQVATAIQQLTVEAGTIRSLVDEIRTGSLEQSRGVEQISRSISQMEHVTQSAAAGSEETAGAAEELNAQAGSMQETVDRLKVMVDGADSPRKPVRSQSAYGMGMVRRTA